jgi:hypothetical protein
MSSLPAAVDPGRHGAPLRVLQFIDSLAASGAEVSLAELAPALLARGVELHVAYLVDRTDMADRLIDAGAKLWPLTTARSRAGRAVGAYHLVRKLRPQVVHTTLFEADLAGRSAAWAAGVPVVSSMVNPMYGRTQAGAGLSPLKLRAARGLDRITARSVRRFHAISEDVAALMGPMLRVGSASIEVIPRARDFHRLGRWSSARRSTVRSALEFPRMRR